MTQMVEVQIDSVRVSLTNQQRIVLLREVDQERFLPIWIGPYEAEAITISLQEIEIARPQTHDLIIQILAKLNARLIRIEIIALKGDVFYGNLVVEMNQQVYNIDTRPSDSIALAVRAHVPILVSREILKEAGVLPEADIQDQIYEMDADSQDQLPSEGDAADSKQRLSVFEDFLQNVKLDDSSDADDEQDAPGEPGEPDSEV